MSEFVTVAKVGEIVEGKGRAYPVGGRMIAVFLMNGNYHAIDDFCPHMGASLATGSIYKGAVTCPLHAWRFDLSNGCWLDNPKLKVDCHPVRVEGDEIQVAVPAPAPPKIPGKK